MLGKYDIEGLCFCKINLKNCANPVGKVKELQSSVYLTNSRYNLWCD